jgi:hypothetical protein
MGEEVRIELHPTDSNVIDKFEMWELEIVVISCFIKIIIIIQ